MDDVTIAPVLKFRGETGLPGDKSISHRLAMLGSVAEGETIIDNFAQSADCRATIQCLSELGVPIRTVGSAIVVEGRGAAGFRKPAGKLDAQNSGTTVRLLAGVLAASPFESVFVGDASLSRRPMKRILEPLRQFGARLEARDDNFLPLRIHGAPLKAIDYTLPVASAQVKSAVLFAGLHAQGTTRVRQNVPTRNHTEIAMRDFGAGIRTTARTIEIDGGNPLAGRHCTVPGDFSSAAFLIAAALAVPDSRIRLAGVGLNPTRTGFLSLLRDGGARIFTAESSFYGGEAVGDLTVESSELDGIDVGGEWIPNVIDEIPVLAVLGTRTRRGIRIRDAAELRHKESDRIHTMTDNLRALGARVEETPDGLFVPGNQVLRAGKVDSFGDHRIAMALAVAGCFATGPVTIENSSCVGVSFPGFFELLEGLAIHG